jgi:hypothetical protein
VETEGGLSASNSSSSMCAGFESGRCVLQSAGGLHSAKVALAQRTGCDAEATHCCQCCSCGHKASFLCDSRQGLHTQRAAR